MLSAANLTILASRRKEISRKIFQDISESTSCFHHLLPEPREHWITSSLRTNEKCPRVFTRTKRYCTFIQYALNYYQNTTMKRNNVNKHNKLLEISFPATCYICKRFALLGLLLNSIIYVFNTYVYLCVYSLLRTTVSCDFSHFSSSISLHYMIYGWKLNYSDHWVITERSMWTHFEVLSTKLLHGICRVTVI